MLVVFDGGTWAATIELKHVKVTRPISKDNYWQQIRRVLRQGQRSPVAGAAR
jgi:hypothetical protein